MSDKLPPKILVIEYDEVLNSNLCNTIERYWFDVTRVRSPEEALRLVDVNPPNVAIISSRIQGISAKEMLIQLRKCKDLHELPVIFLIDQGELVENYNLACKDYMEIISRPFSSNELMTSIRSLLRKSKPVFQDKVIKYQDISMDLSTFKVLYGNKQIHLGPTEFKILQLFVQKPNNIYSRNQIIDYVWGPNKNIAHRTIDVYINRIRTLLKADFGDKQLIRTIRSSGYKLD